MRTLTFALTLALAACGTPSAPEQDAEAGARAQDLALQLRALTVELRETKARLAAVEAELGPRDWQSGLPSGQRMSAVVEQIAGLVSPRDAASGQATGRTLRDDVAELQSIVSPRDPASGLPTGRTLRQDVEELNKAVEGVRATAITSGDRVTIHAWSSGTDNPMSWQFLGDGPFTESDVDGDGVWETLGMALPGPNGALEAYTLAVQGHREPASGMATGRRQY